MKFRMKELQGKGNGMLITCPTKLFRTKMMFYMNMINMGWQIKKKIAKAKKEALDV